jgi:hypothetical protein
VMSKLRQEMKKNSILEDKHGQLRERAETGGCCSRRNGPEKTSASLRKSQALF